MGFIPIGGGFAIAIIILQALYYSSYNVFFIPLATFASFIPAVVILLLLVSKLLRWFKIKHDYIMLSYTIAMSIILLNAAFLIIDSEGVV